MTGLARLNSLPPEDAARALLGCCGSRRWAAAVADARPFPDVPALLAAARDAWRSLGREDRLEAFRAHPRIGERRAEAEAARGDRERAWSEAEQSGMRDADAETRTALAEGNRAYEARFGWIFLICATDRSPDEMLRALRARLPNDPEREIEVAAAEQERITELRLLRWIHEHGGTG